MRFDRLVIPCLLFALAGCVTTHTNTGALGKPLPQETKAEQAKEAAEVSPRNYQRSDSAGAQPASRPAVNPEIARRGPDLSVFGPGRTARPAAAAQARPTSTAAMEPEHKKLIVGRDTRSDRVRATVDGAPHGRPSGPN